MPAWPYPVGDDNLAGRLGFASGASFKIVQTPEPESFALAALSGLVGFCSRGRWRIRNTVAVTV